MIIDAWFRDPDGCISPSSAEGTSCSLQKSHTLRFNLGSTVCCEIVERTSRNNQETGYTQDWMVRRRKCHCSSSGRAFTKPPTISLALSDVDRSNRGPESKTKTQSKHDQAFWGLSVLVSYLSYLRNIVDLIISYHITIPYLFDKILLLRKRVGEASQKWEVWTILIYRVCPYSDPLTLTVIQAWFVQERWSSSQRAWGITI